MLNVLKLPSQSPRIIVDASVLQYGDRSKHANYRSVMPTGSVLPMLTQIRYCLLLPQLNLRHYYLLNVIEKADKITG